MSPGTFKANGYYKYLYTFIFAFVCMVCDSVAIMKVGPILLFIYLQNHSKDDVTSGCHIPRYLVTQWPNSFQSFFFLSQMTDWVSLGKCRTVCKAVSTD